jgi:preprotein translocase subunit SecD
MSGSDHRTESKKAGLSGLFRARVMAAAALIASAVAAVAEPLVIEVSDVAPILDERTKQPMIVFKMSPTSTKLFAELTTNNLGRKMDLRIEGKTVMSAVIREPILAGSVQVSGGLTLRETKDLADSIAAAKSKVEVEIVNE